MKKNESELYVVGVGASAGGLDAIQQLFDNTPDNTGMAFVIIQHLSPDFVSLMPELLSKHTGMKIYTAKDKQTIEPNCIYLNQRNKNLHIKGRKLYLLDKGPKHNLNLPIDIFFHTLGEEYKERSVAVVLSGTGSDGSRGIKTIKEGGGIVMVQDPITAQFDGMPNSSIATNQVDFILDPKSLGNTFAKLSTNNMLLVKEDLNSETHENLIVSILTELFKFSNIDFRKYKRNTILRRLEKRMAINNIDQLYDYRTFLKSNPEEKEALKNDFLIGVTRFFRDDEAFQVMESNVIAAICNSKNTSETIRVWCAGCSTGEEVYSIAILIDSFIRNKKLNLDFKIFATDIDARALTAAGLGAFHINTINEISKEHLEQYFIKSGDKIQINKRIREKIVFSNHNIFMDPPFINMDLITCRNLLIYLDNKVQNKIMHRFHFSLNKYGYLFLGNSESLGEISKHFKTIDTKWKIYQNISDVKARAIEGSIDNKVQTFNFKSTERKTFNKRLRPKESPDLIFHKYISETFGPDSIFIDKNFEILFISGKGGNRLIHKSGLFENNLLKTVDKNTAIIIRNSIRRLEKENKDILIKDIANKTEDGIQKFDITIKKAKDNIYLQDVYILEFSKDVKVTEEELLQIKDIPLDEMSKQRYEDLENELDATKVELRGVVEELETTNEELQSSNEELMASSEELQSTNEELQSVNEELYTVNSELQQKNLELNYLNDDVNNLLNSTNIGTLFLDTNLRIRKFTPALQKLFKLEEADYGRPIASFASNFNDNTKEAILDDSKEVLKNKIIIEKEVQSNNEDQYFIRIVPFLTSNKQSEGVVITFFDINKLKNQELELKLNATHLNKAQKIAKLGSWYLDLETGEPTWTEELYKMYGFDPKLPLPPFEEHQKLFTKESWDILSVALDKVIADGTPYELELKTVKKDNTNGYMWVRGEALRDHDNNIYALWGAAQDITERKLKDEDIELNNARLESLLRISQFPSDSKQDLLDFALEEAISLTKSKIGYIYYYNELTKRFTLNSWSKEVMHECEVLEQQTEYALEDTGCWGDAVRQREPIIINDYEKENPIKKGTPEGHVTLKKFLTIPLIVENEIVAVIGVANKPNDYNHADVRQLSLLMDKVWKISERISLIKSLKKAKIKAEESDRLKSAFLANMSHEIRTPMNGILGFTNLLEEPNLTGEEQKEYIKIIRKSGDRMLSTINDIIDISKVEAGLVELSYKEINIHEEIKGQYKFFKPEAEKKNIKLILNNSLPDSTQVLISDLQKLNSILTNLIKNAIKYTKDGTIEIGISKKNKNLEFYVKDTGIGIPKNRQKAVFNRFIQADIADKRALQGSGLGLAIVKAYVKLLGGKIWLTSEEGVGSIFYFTLPLENSKIKNLSNKEPNTIEKQLKAPKNLNILIAEDDEVSFKYLSLAIKDMAKEINHAKNGIEAIEICKKKPDLDLILMDIKMPILNGFEATKKIREFNKDIKIIAQTAFALDEDKKKSLEIGCNDYISKPINRDKLKEVLIKWVN